MEYMATGLVALSNSTVWLSHLAHGLAFDVLWLERPELPWVPGKGAGSALQGLEWSETACVSRDKLEQLPGKGPSLTHCHGMATALA